jgi:palmitoyltransferase
MKKRLNTDHGLSVKGLPRKFDGIAARGHSSPSSVSRSSAAGDNSSKKGSLGELGSVDMPVETVTRKSRYSIGGIFCALFVYEDCRKQDGAAEQQGSEEALFCTLCNSQVLRFDKYVMLIIDLDIHK